MTSKKLGNSNTKNMEAVLSHFLHITQHVLSSSPFFFPNSIYQAWFLGGFRRLSPGVLVTSLVQRQAKPQEVEAPSPEATVKCEADCSATVKTLEVGGLGAGSIFC